MKQEIEIEFKNLLRKEEFNNLVTTFHLENSFISQTNHYFDTPTFSLKDANSALRIREKNSTFTMTLKQPNDIGLLETHEKISEELANNIMISGYVFPESIITQLQTLQINVEELEYFGSLTTNRAEIPYKDGLLVLDHSTYHGVEDYEVEYEVADEEIGKQNFLSLLKENKIEIKKTDNKIKRFFNRRNNTIL